MRGILACSIGLRDDGPGLSNVRIAVEMVSIAREEEKDEGALIASQWEITDALWELDNVSKDVDLDILVRERGEYLSGNDLVQIAAPFFRAHGITEVIVVTHWLLAIKIRQLLKKEGFTVLKRKVGWIPCDRQSIQWWTRHLILLLYYAVIQVLFGYQGKYVEPKHYKVRMAS